MTTLRALVCLTVILACTASHAAGLLVDARSGGEPGSFRSIAAALSSIPPDHNGAVTIRIAAGRYDEKLIVERPMVHLIGAGRDQTVITHGDTGDSIGHNGQRMGTSGSFTLRVSAPDFRAENLTIENSFDYVANAALDNDDPAKIANAQGVALMLGHGSDRAVFKNVLIDGHQDTLYADAGRSYFLDSRIAGHVDFIFGAGQAVFESCEIISKNRANKNPTGYITAPSTRVERPFGFLFSNCRLLKDTLEVPAGSVRLGRPWHPGADAGVNGSAVFINCFMDDHVGAEGYAPISSRNAAGERIWYEVGPESRFFEFGSYGPGGSSSPQRPVLSEEAARWYTVENVLNGWSPEN